MFRSIRRHAENITVISILIISWTAVIVAGLYGNGTLA